jgi:hypothetical protein
MCAQFVPVAGGVAGAEAVGVDTADIMHVVAELACETSDLLAHSDDAWKRG